LRRARPASGRRSRRQCSGMAPVAASTGRPRRTSTIRTARWWPGWCRSWRALRSRGSGHQGHRRCRPSERASSAAPGTVRPFPRPRWGYTPDCASAARAADPGMRVATFGLTLIAPLLEGLEARYVLKGPARNRREFLAIAATGTPVGIAIGLPGLGLVAIMVRHAAAQGATHPSDPPCGPRADAQAAGGAGTGGAGVPRRSPPARTGGAADRATRRGRCWSCTTCGPGTAPGRAARSRTDGGCCLRPPRTAATLRCTDGPDAVTGVLGGGANKLGRRAVLIAWPPSGEGPRCRSPPS